MGVSDKKTKINWTCHVCGHKWPSTIFARTRGHNGENKINKCPVCGKCKRAKPFSKDYPDLDEMWNEELNGMKFREIPGDYSTKYWWNCEKHGPFQQSLGTMIRARNTKNKGCPYCNGKLPKKNLCQFKNGKIYNRELNASYNIGGQIFPKRNEYQLTGL